MLGVAEARPTPIREGILNTEEQDRIEAVIDLCRQAKVQLLPDTPFRLRVLLDMTLLELDKELARLTRNRVS